MPAEPGVTQLLLDWSKGDQNSLERLTPIVYEELRRLARFHLRNYRPDATLQPTALVHEAYLKLADDTQLELRSRAHFFAVAARAMRQILVDHWRKRQASKRSGVILRLEDNLDIAGGTSADILALDDCLRSLAGLDERKSRAIELRYFGGLTSSEIAKVLDVSEATVARDLQLAQAWLYREMSRSKEIRSP